MVNTPTGPAGFEQVIESVCISHQRGKHGRQFITATEKGLLTAFVETFTAEIGWLGCCISCTSDRIEVESIIEVASRKVKIIA